MPIVMKTGAGALLAPAGSPAFSGYRATTDVWSSANQAENAAIRQARVGGSKITSSATAIKASITHPVPKGLQFVLRA